MIASKLMQFKQSGEKLAMLTCYDATFAKLMVEQGVDILLVGDSLGMVLKGQADTLKVSIQEMAYHTSMVREGAPNAMIVTDMPANSYEHQSADALRNAQALLAAGADMVKIEGGGNTIACTKYLVDHGIPVCGHLGFTPQSVHQLGGYKIQGKTDMQAHQILHDALALQEAGASLLVLEMIPAALASQITAALSIATIGIGAGVNCDGQVLVLHDLLGIYTGPASGKTFKSPRFVKNFLSAHGSIQSAISHYVQAVKTAEFPGKEHSY